MSINSQSTKQTWKNSLDHLPKQYKAAAKQLNQLLNITANFKARDVIKPESVYRIIGTLFMIDKAAYFGTIVPNVNTIAKDYQIPSFLKYIVLPKRIWFDSLPLRNDLVDRYENITYDNPLSIYEWDDLMNRLEVIVKIQKINLETTRSDVDTLRSNYDFVTLVTNASNGDGKVRSIDVPSIFDLNTGFNINKIDSTFFVNVSHYLKIKWNSN